MGTLEIPQGDPCPFCECLEGSQECSFIFRDDKVASMVDLFPVEPGHVLVMPVDHFTSALDIPQDIAMRAFAHANELAAAVIDALGATGVNIFQNNGINAGQRVSHYHIHVLPRYPDKDFDEARSRVEKEMGMFRARERTQLSIAESSALATILQERLSTV